MNFCVEGEGEEEPPTLQQKDNPKPLKQAAGAKGRSCKVVSCDQLKKAGTAFCNKHSATVRAMKRYAETMDKKHKTSAFTQEYEERTRTDAGWVAHRCCICVWGCIL